MKIIKMRVNHLQNPLGYDCLRPTFSFQVEESTGKTLKSARIRVAADPAMTHVIYDSGMREDVSGLSFQPDCAFEGGRRYYWNVAAVADNGDTTVSEPAWFEGGRDEEVWNLPWITSPFDKEIHPVFFREFSLPQSSEIETARLYITGLGLYEAYLNGKKVGDEYLAPFYNDYRYWIQYQTYDIADQLQAGQNTIAVMLGNGWYKGRFGYLGDGTVKEYYGDRFLLSAELLVVLKSGETVRLEADESWECGESPVKASSIYDGEVYDGSIKIWDEGGKLNRNFVDGAAAVVRASAPTGETVPRLSPKLVIHERFEPKELIITPKGEQVIDFGQEITGWVEFDCNEEKGTEILLQFGEILQEGCFYRDNYRTSKSAYTYLSGGEAVHVRPHFTFYGFRYMKVSGIRLNEDNLRDYRFEACAVYSDLEQTGRITTSNAKLNRLLENTLWGQKGNFLDVPTDCPQRDERMGWTGDAQVFCAAASYHMYTPAFYKKYLKDMLFEQRANHGAVPYVVPDLLSLYRERQNEPAPAFDDTNWGEAGSCAWGDAATIIPWTMYEFYGDRALLAENYENMKQWTDFIVFMDETYCGGSRLWTCGFHFADWLALDNPDKESCFGRTDPYYVASVYYMYSAELTAKAAKTLGKEKDAAYYSKIAGEVREAVCREYITSTGRVAIDTQTALVLAIYFDLIPDPFRERAARDLKKMLIDKNMHLNTGFVGTAYLCKALSKAGMHAEAYTLLLQEDFPSWLYEVNMGATTVWERWNSVLPDGRISDTGMNSLNHYSYGAVAEWVYRTVCGISQREGSTGFRTAVIAPVPDQRLEYAYGEYEAAIGTYRSGWKYREGGVEFEVTVPFDGTACFMVPSGYGLVSVNGNEVQGILPEMTLTPGNYKIVAKQV